jgi:hypothetical protein
VNVKFIKSDVEIVLNDGFNAVQRTFEMDADMIGTPAYTALKMLSDTNADTVVRRRAKTGAVSLIPAKVSFNEEETLTESQAVTVRARSTPRTSARATPPDLLTARLAGVSSPVWASPCTDAAASAGGCARAFIFLR